MKPSTTGYKFKPLKFKDWSYRHTFGSAAPEPILPLGRSISGVPVICQGTSQGCVPCTVTFVQSFLETSHPSLSWEWLANIGGTKGDGSVPSDILAAARNKGIATDTNGTDADKHKLGGYYQVDCVPHEMYRALKTSPLAIGVKDFQGAGPHFMCAFDVNEAGQLLCANWWSSEAQQVVAVDMSDVIECIAFGEDGGESFGVAEVLFDKLLAIPKKILITLALSVLALFGVQAPQQFGASGIYDAYSPVVGGSGISATDNFLPVSTLSVYTGETITAASTTFPVYFIINPSDRTNREKIECNGLDVGNKKWTSCYRGLSAVCNNATSTVAGAAFPHSAGQSIIMSNDSCFYNRFVDNTTNQNVGGIKTLTANQLNIGSTTTELLVVGGKAGWSDNGGVSTFTFASGSSGLTASTTKGVFVTNSQIGVNASSTGGVAFDSNGLAYVSVSSTSSTNGGFLNYVFGGVNKLYWDVASFLSGAWTWTGLQTFNGGAAVAVPTTTTGATPKGYVDNQIIFGQATGTAQVAITAGNALWMSATSSQMQLTNSSVASSTYQFVGITASTTAAGLVTTYTKPGGINCNQSGLTPGLSYYLNGAAGQISSTPGTLSARIGVALTTTCLQVMMPKFVRTGKFSFTATGNTVVSTGFYPAHIELRTGCNPSNNGIFTTGEGFSVGDETNNSTGWGYNGTNYVGGVNATAAINNFCNGATQTLGTISARDASTFTVNVSNYSGTQSDVQWTAWSE